MAPMMMKLKLAAISFGVAQATVKICADDAAFDGTKSIDMGGQPTGCAMVQLLMTTPFEATKDTCAGDYTFGDKPIKAGLLMSMFSSCCTTGSDVCSAWALNPCATASDYKPAHKFTQDGNEMTCTMWSATAGPFTPSATTCQAMVKVGDSEIKNGMMTAMAASKGCCGTGKSNCAQFQVTPCADATKFLPDAPIDGVKGGLACSAAMADVAQFTATTATCAETVTIGGNAGTRTKHMASAAPHCCSDKVSICANPGSAPTGTKAADTSVSSGSVGACVANIFLAIVAYMLA